MYPEDTDFLISYACVEAAVIEALPEAIKRCLSLAKSRMHRSYKQGRRYDRITLA